MQTIPVTSIAIIGGGPAALFLLKALIETAGPDLHITIFEKQSVPGMGMPYSPAGASAEHVTNVSANEIPGIVTSFSDWIDAQPASTLEAYGLDKGSFHEYKVLPRLLFGEYLSRQFELLLRSAKEKSIPVKLLTNNCIEDIYDDTENNRIKARDKEGKDYFFDRLIICTGHRWPKKHEGKIPGWFDSPYPPQKLAGIKNVRVAIKGASLTAIDAVRTLSRANGNFTGSGDELQYKLKEGCEDFRIVLHSLHGLLPAVRFHLQDSHLSQGHSFTEEEIFAIKEKNDGFVPLDLVYEKCFKEPIKNLHGALYDTIRHMRMEDFVDHMMSLREKLDGFTLLKAEYREAEKSIDRKQSVLWKEMLAVLSYELNYPAKHFCAEDMLRLKKKLMPLISIIIAFVPQPSCDELFALHDAGVLTLQPVDEESEVEPGEEEGCVYHYNNNNDSDECYSVFVNATGQPAFMVNDFLFPGLLNGGTVTGAHVKFREAAEAEAAIAAGNDAVVKTGAGDYWLSLPGIQINDHYQVLDKYGTFNSRIHVMAVPYIAGLNPDYSGLDFCERAGKLVAESIVSKFADT